MRKEVIIRENAGLARDGEYVRVSLPLACGELLPEREVSVSAVEGINEPCQRRVLKTWPDGSVKWLLVDFPARVPAMGAVQYLVSDAPADILPAHAVAVLPGADRWQVETGAATFIVDARTLRPFASVLVDGREVLDGLESRAVFDLDGSGKDLTVEAVQLEEDGAMHAVLRLTGRAALPRDRQVRFTCRLHFFAASPAVQVEFTLQNPHPALHPGGLWDLGDPGALIFRDCSFLFVLAGRCETVSLSPEPGGPAVEADAAGGLSVYQESSGGANWRSPNHRNASGEIPLALRGYLVTAAGVEVARGLRAAPVLRCGGEWGIGIAAVVPRFWQEFPKALCAVNGAVRVELFPGRFPDRHELQGGEQKTHQFWVDFSARPDSLSFALSPLKATVLPRHYRDSMIFCDLPGQADLIDSFADPELFLEKRERLDEFGWRNFGEVYADHEALYHEGEGPLVSHYNNQYDFCAGAYRKCFATGDDAWQELAADLVRHVKDIDLYHTDLDREEYNRGMFWHTDHYVDAGLATHRSFSKLHLGSKDRRFCGGGPGAEHCYTTGLTLHYFQTGEEDFRHAVLDLAQWVQRSLDGPQTVLAALKRGVSYLKRWHGYRGSRRYFPRYPLTRGTGNAITACLDAFEVGGGRRFLERAEELIRGALHPSDDVAARNLLDAELAWSYTVLLAAVAKYLDKKRELGELDGHFAYARTALLSYAVWMLENEYPYLDKPEKLEYPNETWAAQDLRKSVVLYEASRHAPLDLARSLRDRGTFFFASASSELSRRDTSMLARPLVLMLQNGWVGSRLQEEPSGVHPPDLPVPEGAPIPYLTLHAVVARVGSELLRALRESSPRREWAWLRARLTDG